jgi:hypothetical protein
MTTSAPTETPTPPSAYELLSKPIGEISNANLEVIVADLRRRRAAYKNGTADRPDKVKAAKAAPKTPTEIQALTADLLADLNLKF